ncbi:MAG: hypothetical protein OXD39_08905 [Gemmatimonadetes bacterium]|nr:hypothetical protein [Gemmatimonadota bacterium]
MKTLNERVDDLENKYEVIESGIATLSVNVGHLMKDTAKLKTEMETRLDALDTKVDRVLAILTVDV